MFRSPPQWTPSWSSPHPNIVVPLRSDLKIFPSTTWSSKYSLPLKFCKHERLERNDFRALYFTRHFLIKRLIRKPLFLTSWPLICNHLNTLCNRANKIVFKNYDSNMRLGIIYGYFMLLIMTKFVGFYLRRRNLLSSVAAFTHTSTLFITQISYISHLPYACYMFSYLIPLDLISVMIFSKE